MKTRIIVAAIGLPLLLAVLCVLPPFATAALFSAVCCIGAYELFHVMGLGERKAAMVLCMVSAVCVQGAVLLGGYRLTLYIFLPFLVLLFALWVAYYEKEIPFGMEGLAGAVFSLIVPSALWSLLILLSYLLLCLRNYLERPVLPSLRFETKLQELVCAVTRPKPSQDEDVDRDLYERCCQLMDRRKPFLVDKFSLTDLARALYTNKVYLSRSINYYSGKNFRQFVNYYRVKYAMEQFVANKHLRVSELSELSGFHSTVSFNMAFKLVTGVTPSDWKRQCLQSARRAERRP